MQRSCIAQVRLLMLVVWLSLGLEMTQNSERLRWSREEVDAKLHEIMNDIHANCVKYGRS